MVETSEDQGAGQAPVAWPDKRLRWLLIGSLALNLLVIGVVGGGLIAGRGGPHPFGGVDMTLGPFAEALDRGDRDILRTRLQARQDIRPLDRSQRDAALRDFLTALRAQPFDQAAVEQIFSDQRSKATGALAAGQEALLDRVVSMTPEARGAFADRLERRLGRGGNPDGDDH